MARAARARPVLRAAVPADAEALERVWIAAWRQAYAGLMPDDYLAGLDVSAARARKERQARSEQREPHEQPVAPPAPKASTLVLEVGSEIVGFCRSGSSRDSDAGAGTAEVYAINLHPDWWRQGLGRDLLAATLAHLAAQGFTSATLWVLHDNARARRFYESQGWAPDGTEKYDDRLIGSSLHEVRYGIAVPRAR